MGALEPVMVFSEPVLLVGGGECDLDVLRFYASRGYTLVAADGGAEQFARCDLVPSAIIGDLDSLKERQAWAEKTKVIEVSEQDTTDFEKCLYSTQAPHYLALGFTGLQFDHTLAALHVLAKYAGRKKIVMVDSLDVLYAASEPLKLALEPGTRISIFPLSRVEFEKSIGLEYPLDGLIMEMGDRIGTSNRAVERDVEITTIPDASGSYAMVLPFAYLDDLLATL